MTIKRKDIETEEWRGELLNLTYDDIINALRGRDLYFKKLREERTKKFKSKGGKIE